MFGSPATTWPGPSYVPSVTEDGADTSQFTQEFRIASATHEDFRWEIGAFYFDSQLEVETENFASFDDSFNLVQNHIVRHDNRTWAVFGQGRWDVTDRLNLTAGVRLWDDDYVLKFVVLAYIWAVIAELWFF